MSKEPEPKLKFDISHPQPITLKQNENKNEINKI